MTHQETVHAALNAAIARLTQHPVARPDAVMDEVDRDRRNEERDHEATHYRKED